MFMGTPHRGSSWAELGKTIRRIVAAAGFDTTGQNVEALQFDSDSLRITQEGFVDLYLYGKYRFEVRTFQEAQGVTSIGIHGLNRKVRGKFIICNSLLRVLRLLIISPLTFLLSPWM